MTKELWCNTLCYLTKVTSICVILFVLDWSSRHRFPPKWFLQYLKDQTSHVKTLVAEVAKGDGDVESDDTDGKVGEPDEEDIGEQDAEKLGEPDHENIGEQDEEKLGEPDQENVGEPEKIGELETEKLGEPDQENVGEPEKIGELETEKVGELQTQKVD